MRPRHCRLCSATVLPSAHSSTYIIHLSTYVVALAHLVPSATLHARYWRSRWQQKAPGCCQEAGVLLPGGLLERTLSFPLTRLARVPSHPIQRTTSVPPFFPSRSMDALRSYQTVRLTALGIVFASSTWLQLLSASVGWSPVSASSVAGSKS